jgi:hypothetical protein
VQVNEVLHKVTELIEDHICMSCDQLFLFLFFGCQNTFQEPTAFLKELFRFLLGVALVARDNPILFIILLLALLPLDCIIYP